MLVAQVTDCGLINKNSRIIHSYPLLRKLIKKVLHQLIWKLSEESIISLRLST